MHQDGHSLWVAALPGGERAPVGSGHRVPELHEAHPPAVSWSIQTFGSQ